MEEIFKGLSENTEANSLINECIEKYVATLKKEELQPIFIKLLEQNVFNVAVTVVKYIDINFGKSCKETNPNPLIRMCWLGNYNAVKFDNSYCNIKNILFQ